MAERNRLFAKHPRTNFIAAHLAFHGNDLERLGKLFDSNPNVYVDIAAVLAELGRQPYSAHDFLLKYQDRVLMGKDIYDVSEYKWYFRALETRDEYFEYYRKRHAFWRIYGFQVPDEVLKKVYYKNALKLVPGIDAKSVPGVKRERQGMSARPVACQFKNIAKFQCLTLRDRAVCRPGLPGLPTSSHLYQP